jgi:hypothetical protein
MYKISTHVENHYAILNELLRTHRHLQQDKLIAPPNSLNLRFITIYCNAIFGKNLNKTIA